MPSRSSTGYYDALVTSPNHYYFFVTAEADITSWLNYFIKGMASVFESVTREIREQLLHPDEKAERLLRKLDRRARIRSGLFCRREEITSKDVARVPALSARQSPAVLNEWWLKVRPADTA
jgi:Fic family protein